MKATMRRLGDAAVVFDPFTWQTHVLPPATAAVADLIEELSLDGPVSLERLSAALPLELGLDSSTPEVMNLLRTLSEIGMLDG